MRIILDAKLMAEREPAHEYLQQSFLFPDYYGRNLDALYDCLTDLRDTEIEFLNTESASPYFKKIYRVFSDAERNHGGIRILRKGDMEEGAFEADYAEIAEVITED